MASRDTSRRRHRPHYSKPNQDRTGQASHAHGSTHMSFRDPWPTLRAAPDGNKENLVQGWLDDIDGLRSAAPDARHAQFKGSHPKHRSRPQPPSPKPWLPHGQTSLADNGSSGLTRLRSIERGRRESRSVSALEEDSSIIAPAGDPDRATTRGLPSASRLVLPPEEFHNEREKRQYLEFGDGPPLQGSSPAGRRFEKRPRHKTRANRYDVVKLDHDDRGTGTRDKENHGAKVRRAKRKKQDNMTSAKEIMDSFNSESILHDRITVSASPILQFAAGAD